MNSAYNCVASLDLRKPNIFQANFDCTLEHAVRNEQPTVQL